MSYFYSFFQRIKWNNLRKCSCCWYLNRIAVIPVMLASHVYFTLYPRVPFVMNTLLGPIISYCAILMNTIIFIVLLKKDIRTPSTVLMQGLAIADSLTALSTYGLEPLFLFFYQEIGRSGFDNSIEVWWTEGNHTLDETKRLLNLKYPYCVIYFCVSQLSDNFHLISVFLTTSLGLQKLLVVAYPIWSRTRITVKASVIVCVVCYALSFAIHIPKMFVVTLQEVNDSSCLISKPNEILEQYVLAICPALVATILICSAVLMFISTSYIIATLCNRKHIRRHTASSNYEKKSCALILCVLVVFLLSEIPRLYINSNLFRTYKTELGEEDIAWSIVQTKVKKKSLACYKKAENKVTDFLYTETNLTANIPCADITSGQTVVPDDKMISIWIDMFLIDRYKGFQEKMINRMKSNYGELVENIVKKLSTAVKNKLKQDMTRMVRCYNNTENINEIMMFLLKGYFACDTYLLDTLTDNFPLLILGSSPYSEPMNYIINTIWGSMLPSLKDLKLLIEILKLCTVVGCASNFVIYVIMSEKLRMALSKTLCKKLYDIKSFRETEEIEIK